MVKSNEFMYRVPKLMYSVENIAEGSASVDIKLTKDEHRLIRKVCGKLNSHRSLSGPTITIKLKL